MANDCVIKLGCMGHISWDHMTNHIGGNGMTYRIEPGRKTLLGCAGVNIEIHRWAMC